MEREKQLFSYIGSVFVFCMLALSAFLPVAKAEAALTVKEINYENSTITISTNASDQVLYFSDKNKKKWEMATDSFENNECTMDISWIAVTKNYVLTLKGDKSEDVLTVNIPKQVSNFKAKYDKKQSKVTFVNAGSRKVQYRKNNTSIWIDVPEEASFSSTLKRLCENGAKVYFRLKAENGSGTDGGQRYSKEAVCSIVKKTAAPTVKINADATISVSSGWQVRRVTIEEGTGILYVTGYRKIDSVADEDVDTEKWYTYRVEKDIPVTEMAEDIAADSASSDSMVYLQFRKAATSSAQVSHITTVGIPKQEAAPNAGNMEMEYTSPTTFKLTIANASTKMPYEFCVVDKSDVIESGTDSTLTATITDMQSVTWKTISSNVPMEVKKSDAPDQGWIFFRKKAVGTVGSDDFKLATAYTAFAKVDYPEAEDGDVSISNPNNSGTVTVIDGTCTEDNTEGYIRFTVTTKYNAKIANIGLSTSPSPKSIEECLGNTATVTSSVTKSGDSYLVNAVIKAINLSDNLKEQLKNNGGTIKLYAYIQLATSGDVPGYVTSSDTSGLRIEVKAKSYIETDVDETKPKNQIEVTRIIGSSTSGSITSDELYDKFWFNIHYGSEALSVSSVKLGNYTLPEDCYNVAKDADSNIGTFTVDMTKLEAVPELKRYYGTKQSLAICLNNGEKLTDVKITLVEPVSLNDTYSWAFRATKLPQTEQEIITTTNGTTVKKTEYINNYSAGYTKTTTEVNGIKVDSVELTSAKLNGKEILYSGGKNNNVIEFFNDALNEITDPVTSQPVVMTFTVKLTNSTSYTYIINSGCTFTILS